MWFPLLAIALGLMCVSRKKNPDVESSPEPVRVEPKLVKEKPAAKPAISPEPQPAPEVVKKDPPPSPDPAEPEKEKANGREKVP